MSKLILSLVGRNYSLLKLSSHQSYTLLSSNKYAYSFNPTCNLYSEAALGIEKLNILQESKCRSFEAVGRAGYINRMANYIKHGDYDSIIKTDLVSLIGLAENEEHLDLIESIAKNVKHETGDGSAWGSTLMRVYYKMNQVDRAYNNIKDEQFGSFFNQQTSYQVAMTMLYKAGRYNDVLEIYQQSIAKLDQTRTNTRSHEQALKTNRRLAILVFASLAKLNGPEHFEQAQALYAQDVANPILKPRVLEFLAYMAIQHNKPVMALNLLTDSPRKTNIANRNMNTLALIMLKRYEDVLLHLRECVALTRRDYKLMFREIHDSLKSKLGEIQDGELAKEMGDILVDFKDNDLISEDKMESIVFKDVDSLQRIENRVFDRSNPGRYGNKNR